MNFTQVVSALVLSLAAMTASALSDNYVLGDITLDGTAWTDATSTITMGETYALTIGLSYERPLWAINGNSSAGYVANPAFGLEVNGLAIGSASAAEPLESDSRQLCSTLFCFPLVSQISSAEWLLTGSLNFGELAGGVGIHNVSFSANDVDEFSRAITVAAAPEINAVPAPGTLAIFALGLFGLVGARRLKQRR